MDPILAIVLIALVVLVALYIAHRLFTAQVDAASQIPVFRTVEGAIYRVGEKTVDDFADYVDKLNPDLPTASPPAPVDKPAVVVQVAIPAVAPAPVPTSAPIAPAV